MRVSLQQQLTGFSTIMLTFSVASNSPSCMHVLLHLHFIISHFQACHSLCTPTFTTITEQFSTALTTVTTITEQLPTICITGAVQFKYLHHPSLSRQIEALPTQPNSQQILPSGLSLSHISPSVIADIACSTYHNAGIYNT